MKREYKVEGVEQNNPNNWGGMCSRAIALEAKEKDFEKGIDTVATTEAPALVVDWERWEVIREILPMKYREGSPTGKVPLLDSHNRSSVEKVKGSASDFTIDGANLMCKTYISATEAVIRQKVSEGHIDSVSIGYMTDREFSVEIPKGASVIIDGTSYKNQYEDGYPMVVRTWWKEHELSLVPIGADQAAKFKSELEQNPLALKVKALEKEIEDLKPKPIKENRLSYHEVRLKIIENENKLTK